MFGFGDFFLAYGVPATLALIMFGLGITLTLGDFKKIFQYPKALIIGLICQMIFLPLIAWLIIAILPLDPVYKVGLLIVAFCPGGATSNFLSHMFKGNVPLSISLTVTNSLISIFTIPFLVNISLFYLIGKDQIIHLNVLETITHIGSVIVLPVLLGMMARYLSTHACKMREKYIEKIGLFFLAVAFVGVFFAQKEGTHVDRYGYSRIIVGVLLLNMGGMVIGYFFPRLFRLGKKNQTTTAIEVGIQNSGLAINIAASPFMLGNPAMAVPASMYGILTFFSSIVIIYFLRKRVSHDESMDMSEVEEIIGA